MFTALLRKLAVRARLFRHVNRLAVNNSGATAVEFGLVAAPFLALLVAIFQTGIVFLASRVLDQVVAQSSRYVMTGQAQTSSPPMTQAGFATYVCNNTFALFTCGKFMINVQNYSNFTSAITATPTISGFNSSGQALDANGNVIAWGWSPGNPGDVVVLQVLYQWPIVLGPLGFNLANLSNGNRLLVSTAVFKNEPY
jgi:Flp pilus assembly protein TadG